MISIVKVAVRLVVYLLDFFYYKSLLWFDMYDFMFISFLFFCCQGSFSDNNSYSWLFHFSAFFILSIFMKLLFLIMKIINKNCRFIFAIQVQIIFQLNRTVPFIHYLLSFFIIKNIPRIIKMSITKKSNINGSP